MIDKHQRAGNSRAIIDNPVLVSALAEIEAGLIEQCINAPLHDDESRAVYAAEVRAVRSVRAKLRAYIAADNDAPVIRSIA